MLMDHLGTRKHGYFQYRPRPRLRLRPLVRFIEQISALVPDLSHHSLCFLALSLSDVCNSTDLPEVEIISLLEEQLPHYKLRADTIYGYDHDDWLHTPLISPDVNLDLTTEQIEETLKYFRKHTITLYFSRFHLLFFQSLSLSLVMKLSFTLTRFYSKQ